MNASDEQLHEAKQALRAAGVEGDAVVVGRTDATTGQAALVVYLVTASNEASQQIEQALQARFGANALPVLRVPLASVPLTAAGAIDDNALLHIPVLDAATRVALTAQVCAVDGVAEAELVVEERLSRPLPLHLSDLLPGWSRGRARARHEQPSTAPAAIAAPAAVETGAAPTARLSLAAGVPIGDTAILQATLPDILRRAAQETSPDDAQILYRLRDGSELGQSYRALLEDAERIAGGLKRLGLKPGDNVIFQLDLPQDFIGAFWGCMLLGLIAVPLGTAPSYTTKNGAVNKLESAWKMLGEPLIIAGGASSAGSAKAAAVAGLRGLLDAPSLSVADIDVLRAAPRLAPEAAHRADPDDVALILLTSGSTGQPKGVQLAHRNVLARSAATSQHNHFTSSDVTLNWFPLEHVGGIVMFHIRDVYLKCRQIHAPTEVVLDEPLRWLVWVEQYRVTLTWAPNFAFALINEHADELAQRRFELSSLRFILNAGEAIVAKTARRFLELLAPHGLPGTANHPAWGMSETSSGVTYSDRFSLASTADSDPFVEVGAPIPGTSVRIVDQNDVPVPEGKIGRLQILGPTVTRGYYGRPVPDLQNFTADGWLKTGDLGYLKDRQLAITGREKDIIIINGVNYYSHEIESLVEDVPGIDVSFNAACAVRDPGVDTDRLAVFFTPSDPEGQSLTDLLKALRARIVSGAGVNPDYLVPVTRQDIPKTSIGKIQRAELRRRLEAGEFAETLKQVDIRTRNANTLPRWFFRPVWQRQRREAEAVTSQGTTLILMDAHGLGEALCQTLGPEVVKVHPGGLDQGFVETGDGFRIAPGVPEHYDLLLSCLEERGQPPTRALHLMTWEPVRPPTALRSGEGLQEAQARGLYSVLYLTQALLRRAAASGADRQEQEAHPALADDFESATFDAMPSGPVELVVVSHAAQDPLDQGQLSLDKATLLGMLKTLPQEAPQLVCRHIDVELGEPAQVAAMLLGELTIAKPEAEVALRGGERYVRRLEAMRPPARATQDVHPRPHPFIAGGAYLITGGLGGIGRRVAAYLVERYDARLILVGRSSLPAAEAELADVGRRSGALGDKAQALLDLSKLVRSSSGAAAVRYATADVCDRTALLQAVSAAEAAWGRPLDGILHLAGSFSERLLADETSASLAAALGPRTAGALNLAALLDERPHAHLVTFAFASGFFGNAAMGGYNAGARFQDSLCLWLGRHARGAYSLAWSLWDGIGQGASPHTRDLALARGYLPITADEGVYSLEAALSADPGALMIGLDASNRFVARHFIAPTPLQRVTVCYTARAYAEPGAALRALVLQDRFGTPVKARRIRLAQMPHTPEGTIDHEQLGELVRRGGSAMRKREMTPLEQQIAAVWQEVLRVPRVGVDDNFFDLGGHSLLATQAVSRLRKVLDIELSLKHFFEHPTVAELAQAAEHTALEEAGAEDLAEALADLGALSDAEAAELLS